MFEEPDLSGGLLASLMRVPLCPLFHLPPPPVSVFCPFFHHLDHTAQQLWAHLQDVTLKGGPFRVQANPPRGSAFMDQICISEPGGVARCQFLPQSCVSWCFGREPSELAFHKVESLHSLTYLHSC